MKIIIGADICATQSNEEYFLSGDIDTLIGSELVDILKEHDVRIFNLEGPLIDMAIPLEKSGPNLKMKESTISGIKNLNVSLLTLANNHIMDYGDEGYRKTISLLQKMNIPYVGVGDSLEQVEHSYIISKQGIRVGVYACAEHEFTIASESCPGANPYDPLYSFDHIEELRKECDFLIVLYHGGKEYYRYPSPDIQRIFRKMAEKGADIVVAQHTHCIGCYEKYNGSILVYGQGNFIFDNGNDEFWNSGMLLSIELEREKYDVQYIFITKNSDGTIRKANYEEENSYRNDFEKRSQNVKDLKIVKTEYVNYARRNFDSYLRVVHGNNIYIRALNKLSGRRLFNYLYKDRKCLLGLLNYIECEAHRELLIEALRKDIFR